MFKKKKSVHKSKKLKTNQINLSHMNIFINIHLDSIFIPAFWLLAFS